MPNFKQRDLNDSGVACLSYILSHYHKPKPVAQLRIATGTDQYGSTALGLISAAKLLGFTAKGSLLQTLYEDVSAWLNPQEPQSRAL